MARKHAGVAAGPVGSGRARNRSGGHGGLPDAAGVVRAHLRRGGCRAAAEEIQPDAAAADEAVIPADQHDPRDPNVGAGGPDLLCDDHRVGWVTRPGRDPCNDGSRQDPRLDPWHRRRTRGDGAHHAAPGAGNNATRNLTAGNLDPACVKGPRKLRHARRGRGWVGGRLARRHPRGREEVLADRDGSELSTSARVFATDAGGGATGVARAAHRISHPVPAVTVAKRRSAGRSDRWRGLHGDAGCIGRTARGTAPASGVQTAPRLHESNERHRAQRVERAWLQGGAPRPAVVAAPPAPRRVSPRPRARTARVLSRLRSPTAHACPRHRHRTAASRRRSRSNPSTAPPRRCPRVASGQCAATSRRRSPPAPC